MLPNLGSITDTFIAIIVRNLKTGTCLDKELNINIDMLKACCIRRKKYEYYFYRKLENKRMLSKKLNVNIMNLKARYIYKKAQLKSSSTKLVFEK